MDRIVLTVNGNVLYDNQAPGPAPAPTPTPPPAPPPSGAVFGGTLTTPGAFLPIPVGDSYFNLPVVGGSRYQVRTSELGRPVTATATRPDGTAIVSDFNTFAQLNFQAQADETVRIDVSGAPNVGNIGFSVL